MRAWRTAKQPVGQRAFRFTGRVEASHLERFLASTEMNAWGYPNIEEVDHEDVS
jgi:hypothetical protein